MAINTERLRIAVNVGGNFESQLTKLSAQLKEVAAAQRMVDESMTIRVNTSGVGAAKRQLAGLGGDGGGATAMTSGGRSDFLGNAALRRKFGVERQSIDDAMGMPGPMDDDGPGSLREALSDLRRTVREGDGAFGDINLQMRHFYDILAAMLPLLLNFVAALPAAITALVTLGTAALAAAGAIGAIGGLGLLGLAQQRGGGNIGEGFKDILKEIKTDFLDAFAPLAEMFTPIARDALQGLEALFDAIAARGDVLAQMRDDARALGGFILDTVPPLLSALTGLAEAFGPIFGAFGEWAKGTDVLAGFADVTRRALPYFITLIGAIAGLLPLIVDLSLGFLKVASTIVMVVLGVTRLIGIFSPLLDMLGLTGSTLGVIIGLLLTLVTVMAVWNKLTKLQTLLMGSKFIATLEAVGIALWQMIAAEIGAVGATIALIGVVTVLLGVLTLGVSVIGGWAAQWGSASSAIDEATKSLKGFKNAQKGLGRGVGVGVPVGRDAKMGGVNQTNITIEGANSSEQAWETANKAAFVNKTRSPTR